MYTAKLTIMLRCFLFSFTLLTYLSIPAHATETLDGWIESENIETIWSNPARSRRSPDATVDVKFINKGSDAIAGPLRFVIQSLTPDIVSLTNADGTMGDSQYFTLIAADNELAVGASVNITKMAIAGGGKNIFQMSGKVFIPAIAVELAVDITSPETLKTVGYSPYPVSGIINNISAELTLNGVPIVHQNGEFVAQVELTEGFNTVVARATTAQGEQVTNSIVLSLDLTPPYLTVESHKDAQTVYADKITVTGLINDIVRGTVEAEQAQVQVNGVTASVSNRSYAAHNIPLTEGENTITITGIDQVGNSASISRKIIYKVISGSKLELVSGQNQETFIATQLPEVLKVQLVDTLGTGIAGETVIFRVIQGAGKVGVGTPELGRAVIATTDIDGFAQTSFLVGPRSGVANHKVKAKVVGYENEIIFNATAKNTAARDITVNSGDNQRGTVKQALPSPFIVAVIDDRGNTVQGAPIRFETSVGEGLFQNNETFFETITDSDGRASAQFILGTLEGIDAQRAIATLIGVSEENDIFAVFSATAFIAGEAGNTSVTGVVLDNQDTPIPGITLRIENTDRVAITDNQGRFAILQAPVGPIHIIADGSTATVEGEFPSLSYHLVTVAGVENPMAAPIFMVKLDTENGVLAGAEDAVLTLPDYPGFKLEIAKNSVTFPDGSRQGVISATPVNYSKVPMTPPNGMQPQFVLTIQPVGSTFSPPAKLTTPNLGGSAAGEQVEMYSFDHDLEEFVAIGLGTVSEDGSQIKSNIGVGVVKAGWHFPRFGRRGSSSSCSYNCSTCYFCDARCNCKRDLKPVGVQDDGDCKTNICGGDTIITSSDVPEENSTSIGDCKKPGCSGANPHMSLEIDDTDITEDDKKCATCSGGEKIEDPDKVGDECGDGSSEKECYTCKGGSCDNHCDAPTEKTTKSISPPGFEKTLYEALDVLQAGLPYFSITRESSVALEEERGKKCCKDCSKGAEPQDYVKSTVVGKASIGLTFIVPSLGGIFELQERTYGPIKAGGKITLGPGAKGKFEMSASGSGESSKCDDEDCFEMEGKFDGSAGVGVYFLAEGKVKYCNVFNEKDCDNLVAGNAEAETSVNLGANLSLKAYSGEKCTQKNCISYNVGQVEFKTEVKYDIKVFDVYKYEYKNEVKVPLTDGLTKGGNCG